MLGRNCSITGKNKEKIITFTVHKGEDTTLRMKADVVKST